MKRLILSVCFVVGGFGLIACEKHDWDKTKRLYQHNDHHEEHDKEHDVEKAE